MNLYRVFNEAPNDFKLTQERCAIGAFVVANSEEEAKAVAEEKNGKNLIGPAEERQVQVLHENIEFPAVLLLDLYSGF